MGVADAQAMFELAGYREQRARGDDDALLQRAGVTRQRIEGIGQFYSDGQAAGGPADAQVDGLGVEGGDQLVAALVQGIVLAAQVGGKAAIGHVVGYALLQGAAAGQLGDQFQVQDTGVPAATGDPAQTQVTRQGL